MGKKKNDIPQTVFAEWLEEYNDSNPLRKLTQAKLSEMLKVSTSQVSKYLNGDIDIPFETKLDLCRIFNKPEYLALDDAGRKLYTTMKHSKAVDDLGLNDDCIETLLLIKAFSTPDEDLSALLKAMLENKGLTVSFLRQIYSYLSDTYVYKQEDHSDLSSEIPFPTAKYLPTGVLLGATKDFLDNIVGPKLVRLFQKNNDRSIESAYWLDMLSDEEKNEYFQEQNEMIQACIDEANGKLSSDN